MLCENVPFRRTVFLPHYDDEVIDLNWCQLHHRYAGIDLDYLPEFYFKFKHMIVITTTVINQIVPLSGVLGMLIKPATAQLIAFVMKTIITIIVTIIKMTANILMNMVW